MSENRPQKRKIEFIESYWTGGEFGSDYQWNDNHGELIRYRDCKHGSNVYNAKDEPMVDCELRGDNWLLTPYWFCADGERREDNA